MGSHCEGGRLRCAPARDITRWGRSHLHGRVGEGNMSSRAMVSLLRTFRICLRFFSKEDGMMQHPYRRWSHAVTGLFLGVFLALPAGAQTTAPTAATPTGKPAVPAHVRAKMQKGGADPLRYDKPAEAMEYLRQRRAPAGQKDVPVERYLE